MDVVWILLGSFGACAFFALLFHCPKNCVLAASLIGTAGYAAYLFGTRLLGSSVAGAFADALVIAILSEIMARRKKAPATLFANYGVETVLIAGSLALAVALVSSVVRAKR